MEKKIILSGMRPTGDLHIGHFEGVLRNWVELQEDNDCFYFVADWHALTTELDTKNIKKYTIEMVKDWLAFGIKPEDSTIFIQSCVTEHAELGLILERLINIGMAERVPTFKAQVENVATGRTIRNNEGKEIEGEKKLETIAKSDISLGFLAYPVLQAADILLYNATHVPVGEDQLPHIELTRELARKFNKQYREIFTLPEALLTESKRVRGTDGRKMSKSYENYISPLDTIDRLTKRIKQTVTTRPRLSDKGDPFECPVYDLHRIFNKDRESVIYKYCTEATIPCYDCKMSLLYRIDDAYKNFREKRNTITDDFAIDVIREGNKTAERVAAQTMNRVKSAMLIDYIYGD